MSGIAPVATLLRRLGVAMPLAVAAAAPGAAQEPPRPTVPEAPESQAANWSGPYLGIEASAGASAARYRVLPFRTDPTVPGFTSGFGQRGAGTPFLVGGHAGYNWQEGPIVFGLDGSLAAATLNRAFDDIVPALPASARPIEGLRLRRDVLGSVRGRLGFSVDDFLLYGALGVAAADNRVGDNLSPVRARPASELFGLTYGFGLEAALSPQIGIGVDYRRSFFEAARAGGALDLLGLPRAKTASDDVSVRLTWHPDGLKLAPDAPEDPPGRSADWSLHGQSTFIQQGTPGFRSPYTGPFSFLPEQARETWSVTGYLGRRLWEGGEVYYNPEVDQGFGLSNTLGIAGFINGEAQKAGAPYPKFRSQRYFVRQTFGLGGETESVPDGLNQIAGTRDIDRITVTVGKFAVGDFFDDNSYAHDPRLNFNNWALWESAAFDFPANLPGYTQGIVAELNRKDWAFRAGAFQVPKEPNSDVLDPRITRRGGLVAELEERFTIADQPGKLRLGIFSNVGRTADYRDALAVSALSGGALDPNDAATVVRGAQRKSGVYANVEQAVTDDLGLFARASYNDGRSQILSFTDVDRSLAGGFALKGSAWDRPKDTIGVGATANFLSSAHRDFLAAGGLGLLIGDGQLRYSPERAIETYYKVNLADAVDLTFDYQLIVNPGYNSDRGPVNVFGLRIHTEF